jgi:hypothetical protein
MNYCSPVDGLVPVSMLVEASEVLRACVPASINLAISTSRDPTSFAQSTRASTKTDA